MSYWDAIQYKGMLCDKGFAVGVRVKVVKNSRYSHKKHDLIGKFGTVKSLNGALIAVELDNISNPMSGYGWYYLKPHELLIVDDVNIKEENNMANITNYLNAVKIKFIGDDRPCSYIYANFDHNVQVNDLCVVKPAHHDFALARIVEVIDKNDLETPREVVARVDMMEYDYRVGTRAKAAELKTKMQERAKQLQDIALYQMLAKDDPAMLELLNEYQALPKI